MSSHSLNKGRMPPSRVSKREKNRIRAKAGDLLVWEKGFIGHFKKTGMSVEDIRSRLKNARVTYRRIKTDGKESERVEYAFQYLKDRLPTLISPSDPWKKKVSMALSLYYRAISDVYEVRNNTFIKRFFKQRKTIILGMLEIEKSGQVEKKEAVTTIQSLITCLKIRAHWVKMNNRETYERALRRDFQLNVNCLQEIIAELEKEKGKVISLERCNALIEGPFRSLASHQPIFLFQPGLQEIFDGALEAQTKDYLKGHLPPHVQEGESRLLKGFIGLN